MIVAGDVWDEANAAAVAANAADPSSFLVHPFGQPTTWTGHASLVEELRGQMSEVGGRF